MKRKHLPLFSLLLTFCLGWGYLSTLLPGIGYSGDAIKFQYVGKVLGIPHAPGYPLYLLLNHLFVTLFPLGSLAYKVNLFSALCAVGACLVLFKILELLGTGRFIAFVIALVFGFSRAFWSQSVVAEVYTLHMLLMAAVMYFLLKWHLHRRDCDFYLATALYALSFGNHLLSITLLPAFTYLVAVTDKRVFIQPKRVLWVLAVVTLGAAQYLYLFWRFDNPQTPYIEGFNGHNFVYFVTGGPFKHLMFAFTPTQIIQERIPLFLSFMRDNIPMLGLALAGAVFPNSKSRAVRTFLLIYFFCNALYVINYNIPDNEGYFSPNDFILAALAGLTLSRVARWVRPGGGWKKGFLLLLPVTLYVTNYPLVDQSGNTGQQERTEAVLEALERDAVVITTNYPAQQAFLYYLLGEGWREERNLQTTTRGWALNGLQAYLEKDKPLPMFGRTGPKADMPLYAYPCYDHHFRHKDVTVSWPQQHLPHLCRIEATSKLSEPGAPNSPKLLNSMALRSQHGNERRTPTDD